MQQKFEDTKITVEFDEAGNRQQLSSGDSLKTLFEKIKKWFSDLNPVAFSGDYSDLNNQPDIPSLSNVLKTNETNVPANDDMYNLGNGEKRWKSIYTKNLDTAALICHNINLKGMPDSYFCKIGNDLAEYNNMLTIGHYNSSGYDGYNGYTAGTAGLAFQIGNGTSERESDAFRVYYDGNVDAHGSFRTTNADYAEYLEWKDKNPGGEDRVGKFVTLSFDKIQIANQGDFICGIISGHPSVVGNHDFDEWVHKYKTDEFGRLVYDDSGSFYALNENYDDSLVYVPRSDRPEWDAVGMLGILRVYDDGTCVPDGYCKVADSGTATSAQALENSFLTPVFKVMKRISPNVIEIFFK